MTQQLASSSRDGTVRIWDTISGQQIRQFSRPQTLNWSIAWNPEGTRLAFGSTDGSIRIENVFQNGTGLRGEFYDNADFTAFRYTFLSPGINLDMAAGAPQTLSPDTFSIRWTGRIEPRFNEAYTFYVTHNDGARLWVNGQLLINAWNNTPSTLTSTGTLSLAAGVKYDIRLDFYENTGSAVIKLEWQSPSQPRQFIPKSQLYPPEGQIAFTANTASNLDVFARHPDGSAEIPLAVSSALDQWPVWSPDGSKLAFVSTRDGNEELYLVNADGSGLRRLTNHPAYDREPAWSPDGSFILFTSGRSGSGDIYRIPVTGTGIPSPTRLTSTSYNEYRPVYSPFAVWITYVTDLPPASGGPEIYVMDPNGTVHTRLTSRSGNDVAPFWSPDGTKLVFRADLNGRGQIFLVTVWPTISISQLTNTPTGSNFFQSWAPDSSKILFTSTRDGNSELYSMNPDGSAQTRLTYTPTSESYAVWSSDARSIAYARDGDVWLMNPDGSNARNLTNTPNRLEFEIVWWQSMQTQ